MADPITVLFEDRPAALVAVKIAALSLLRHNPSTPLLIWVPSASEGFQSWASERVPQAEVRLTRRGVEETGYETKPSVLLELLSEGHDQVVWFDTDMVVTGDLDARLEQIPGNTLVAAEEYFWGHHQGSAVRTVGLGMPVGRTFKATLNPCLLRVNQQHRPLLDSWQQVVNSPGYRASRYSSTRPIHLYSDVEVLTGLLGAKQWSHIEVAQLARGRDIAQCFGPSGFTVRERLWAGRSLPLIVHAMGEKPWMRDRPHAEADRLVRIRSAVLAAHFDVMPYITVAAEYRHLLDEPTDWMDSKTRLGTVLRRAFPRRPAWRELPLAAVDSAQRGLRRRLGVGQLPTAG